MSRNPFPPALLEHGSTGQKKYSEVLESATALVRDNEAGLAEGLVGPGLATNDPGENSPGEFMADADINCPRSTGCSRSSCSVSGSTGVFSGTGRLLPE